MLLTGCVLNSLGLYQCAVKSSSVTWVRVVQTDCAQQVVLPLIVPLAQQLTFFQNKLISLAQLALTDTAAEAAKVVNTLQSSHYKLCGCYGLQTAAALGGKQPEDTQETEECFTS